MKDLYKVLFIAVALITTQFMCYATRTMQVDYQSQVPQLEYEYKQNIDNPIELGHILAKAQNYYARDSYNNPALRTLILKIQHALSNLE